MDKIEIGNPDALPLNIRQSVSIDAFRRSSNRHLKFMLHYFIISIYFLRFYKLLFCFSLLLIQGSFKLALAKYISLYKYCIKQINKKDLSKRSLDRTITRLYMKYKTFLDPLYIC